MTPEEKLVELYAAEPVDHRAVAILERDVWALHKGDVSGQRREQWFHSRFGLKAPYNHVMFRAGLLGHDDWAHELWPLIHKAGLRRIYEICRALRAEPRRADEVRRLAENPELAKLYRISNGHAQADALTVECSPAASRDLCHGVRELVAPFVTERLSGLDDPAVAEEIVDGFNIELTAALNDLMRKVDRIRSSQGARSIIEVKRRDLKRACEFLGLRLPARGGTVDINEARRAHRKLSAQFHPDRTNNNEELTSQYREVQKAWELISEYRP